ncbi:unnamed protein product [Clavelina lepadiformis]|uniref:Uncharacterized protein n=1 Tax=Clavelina lepadiformis TaxID=159417 RepID=A0ABP0FG99_CLALP
MLLTAAEREGVSGMQQRSGDYAPSDQFSAEREGVASMQRGGDSTTSDQAAAEGLGGILLSDGPSTSVQIAVQSEVQPTDGPSTRVHVMDISPLPDAKLTTRKRKAMKSQVLTSSLFKKILLSKSKVPSSNKPIHKRNKKQLQFSGSNSNFPEAMNVRFAVNCIYIHRKKTGSSVLYTKSGVMKTALLILDMVILCVTFAQKSSLSFCLIVG